MSLSHNQFNVIYALHKNPGATQREIADLNGMGLATVNAAYKEALAAGYIEDGCQAIGEGVYGKSITDPCLGWEKSEKLICELAELL